MFKDAQQYLTSYNLARQSDIVFSEILSNEQYEKIGIENYHIITKDNNLVFYRNNSFEINENDVLFVNTMTIKHLFHHLNKLNNLKNIKLITHQTDISIDKKLFSIKPKCVSEWYSPNISYAHPALKVIPLGVANNYSKKNLLINDLMTTTKKKEKREKLYLNFVESTNRSKRANIYDYFRTKKWVVVDDPILSLGEYKERLNDHKFILCPPGNGVDTHRVWESLYLGSIPVVEKNIVNQQYSGLPIITYNKLEELTFEYLDYESSKLKENFDLLTIDKWWEILKDKTINNSASISVKIEPSKLSNFYYDIMNSLSRKRESYLKKLNYRYLQIKRIIKF
tara:strand:+ start:1640 stop:2656 length:1017 start_codon:yes stop_codon:yes gene_type:complete